MPNLNLRTLKRTALVAPAALVLFAGASASLAAKTTATSLPPDTSAIELADSLSTVFRGAAATISPAVVNISMVDKPDPSQANPFDNIPPQLRGRIPMPQNGQMPERRGEGSGVVIRPDGYILTNNHVVAGADELTVRFEDGRTMDATIVGTDPDTDLAVIKVDAYELPAATFTDSDTVQQGDWVVAVGNPFGLDHTVTAGVVSAIGRGGMGLNTFEDFIQTDAAINPGNSGGPMVNLHGQVIGINSAIKSASGGNNGIGFAIPANIAMHVADSLIEDGQVERGWLGVSIQPMTQELARTFGRTNARGALISDVLPDTPAADAGIESGDIVTSINDEPIDSARALLNTIAGYEPGESITVDVDRNGADHSLRVTLGERPGAEQMASARNPANSSAKLGFRVQTLTPEIAQQMRLKSDQGLIITEVAPDSPAAEAGLRPEDVIVEAGRKAVTSPEDLAAAVKNAENGLLLKITRAGRPLFVAIATNN